MIHILTEAEYQETNRIHRLESSWGRIIQHIEGERTFAAISAYVFELDRETNEQRHEQLRNDIRTMGYGYIEMDAAYTYKSKKTGNTKWAYEESFFIPNITKEQALNLGREYDQETILWKDPEQFVELYCDTGNVSMEFQMERDEDGQITFDPEVLKNVWSKLKKGSGNQRGVKFAYQVESLRAHSIPPRSEAYRGVKYGYTPETESHELDEYLALHPEYLRQRTERKRIGTVAFWAQGNEVFENDGSNSGLAHPSEPDK